MRKKQGFVSKEVVVALVVLLLVATLLGIIFPSLVKISRNQTALADTGGQTGSEREEAMKLKQQLAAMGMPSVNTAKSRELLCESKVQEQLGDKEYQAENFYKAKTHYQNALSLKQEALSVDRDPAELTAMQVWGAVLKDIGVVLLELGLLIYAFRRRQV